MFSPQIFSFAHFSFSEMVFPIRLFFLGRPRRRELHQPLLSFWKRSGSSNVTAETSGQISFLLIC
jgi:hypothetical protein